MNRRQIIQRGALATMAVVGGGAIVDGTAQAAPVDDKVPTLVPHGEELCFLSASDLLRLMRSRKVSPVEVARAYLARIERLNHKVNAYVYRTPEDEVLARARDAEQRYQRGEARALEGIPYAIKDLFDFWEGKPNTFGSVIFKDMGFAPPFSAIYIQRLLDAGINPLGKTNTPEFGHEGTTDNVAWGPTSTPFDLRKNSGGSSGGSAAAVAGFLTALTQGSDAGGSVRIPAAFTGTVGYKGTFGLIPQDAPPLPYTPMLHPGPITRTVEDAALSLETMAGFYPLDKSSLPGKPTFLTALTGDVRGKRVAFSPNLDIFPVEEAVVHAVRQGVQALRDAGARVDEIPLGFDQLMITDLLGTQARPATQADLSDLWVAEQSVLYGFARDLFLHIGIPLDLLTSPYQERLNPQFRGMLQRAAATSAMQYRHGDFLAIAVNAAIEGVFAQGYDYIVCPTVGVASIANTRDGNTLGPASINGVPTERTIGWTLTYPFNFSGHPVVSVPAGFAGRMPVGMQIVGHRFADASVLNAARAVEQRHPWYNRYPKQF